ncbi:DEAD/DEAH box helicase family protein [Actinocatenispora comari]|uniref:DNA-repair protein n=1 Tax=Actinocatenispora comari TaxID=2807577 RepID=A0A8J4EMH0_9ACTN|nr:DEAD/DEAH box helicase family protein [Actinocatenispora comari]GIL29185.1 DNA-repair protein [Actinocatenispora comari]
MSLPDLSLQPAYRSGRDRLLDDFYVPCLQESVRYDRAVGYFSSTLYQVVGLAFSDFVRRGGGMRLICSPALSPEDFAVMKDADEIARHAQATVRADLDTLLQHPEAVPATRLLATLIANEIIEVRIAFPEHPSGLFHDKMGIFEDQDGRRVAFTGSANETWRAWGLNNESFQVFCSWRNESELLRTRDESDYFREIWRGREPGIRTAFLEEVTAEQLRAIADDDLDHAIEQVRSHQARERNRRTTTSRPLMEHQRLALEDWKAHHYRGIVNFATGAGKTLTAIEAVKRWTADGGAAVILVPGRDLHAQWIREIETELDSVQVLPAGADSNKSAWMELLPIFSAPGNSAGAQRVIVATIHTFASADFQRRLKSGDHLLIVADEMHRAGSRRVLPMLEATECGATLGLSATYRRQFDTEGTDRLLEYFGPVLSPVIGLAEALMLGLLVPYDYRLHEVQLDDDELEQYEHLTKRIGQLVSSGDSFGEIEGQLQMLLIRRARVLKQARQKVPAASAILQDEYQPGDRWLVYCDDLTQLKVLSEQCRAAGLPILEFYSGMQSDRDAVIRSLGDHGGIVVAIRCLDEGIDVPVTDHALILASSTVEREYIQRRGRVLRQAPGTSKVSAEVHDLMLVNPIGGALTKSEAQRALEFVRLARNSAARERLKIVVSLSQDPIELPDLLDYAEEESD